MITLYHFPGACSRVTMSALEEIGVEFEDCVVNLRAAEQKSSKYLSVNPKAKVPALSIDGHIMTENPAILVYLDRQYPDAKLLPSSADPIEANQGLVDLVWCGGTIHPIVRQIRNPIRFTKGNPEDVKADGFDKFTGEAQVFSERLSVNQWWYGEAWSIVDVYVYWAYSTAAKGDFPVSEYPGLLDHAERVRARPSFQRGLTRELAAAERINLDPAAVSLL